MTAEPHKSNTALIFVAIIGIIGTIVASGIGAIGNYNTEKLRQEAELTQISLISIATQGGAAQTVLQTLTNLNSLDENATITAIVIQQTSIALQQTLLTPPIEASLYPTYTPYPQQQQPIYIQPPQPIITIIVVPPTSVPYIPPTSTPVPYVPPTPIPYSPTPTPLNINVLAQNWQNSGVFVSSGNNFTIRYLSGLWSPCAPPYGCPWVDAGGWTEWNYDLVLEGCPAGALIGRISTVPNNVFCVGNFFSTQATTSGTLEFTTNDNRLEDNAGNILVSIEVH